MTIEAVAAGVGEQLRHWRQRRRLSQLQLASEAGVSARHLSFVETGRAKPSRDMVLHLSGHLDVPLRERNHLLLAAGFAPEYSENTFASARLASVGDAIRQLLDAHDPCPAVVANGRSEPVDANASTGMFLTSVAPDLLEPPANALRIALHPDGLAPRIRNLPVWRGHLLSRLRRQATASGDPYLAELYAELYAYPGGESSAVIPGAAVALPLVYEHEGTELTFVTAIATFGAPLDISVAELAIESFLPADAATAAILRAGSPPRGAPVSWA